MITKKLVIIFGIVLMIAASAQARIIPGRWEKVAAKKPGSNIIVTLKTGDKMECTFIRLSANSLIVSTSDGVERDYSRDNVERITTAEKHQDSLVDGAAIGALSVGIPAGLIVLVCAGSGEYSTSGAEYASFFAIATGIGAGVGLAVDASVKDKDYVTLYEAPYEAPSNYQIKR